VKNTGYLVDLSGVLAFLSIDTVKFTAAGTASVRADCMVTSFNGSTTEPYPGAFAAGCGLENGVVIPLPLPILMLLGGIGALGIASRRRNDGVMV
jgi:hypothetical protein